jgi:sugar phosphate isomerase/epimerase
MNVNATPDGDREPTRRHFLQAAGIGAATMACAGRGWAAAPTAAAPAPACSRKPAKLTLGLASYSLRNFDLDKTIAMTRRAGLGHICFKSMHLPLESTPEQIAAAVEKTKAAGLVLYGCGVVTMRKPAEVQQAFDYAKAAGMTTIVAMPLPEMLPLVNEKVQQYDIKIAIHNHGPGDKVWPTPQSAYEKIQHLDKRVGLCMDIGHTVRAGIDPVETTAKCADRLYEIHMKDVTAATAKGKTTQVGRGIIDVPNFLRALIKIHYAGVVAFEYEEEANDPLPGLAESVGYTKGVLAVV